MNREQKGTLVEEITEEFRGSHTMFVADYRGLDVPGITTLRNQLRDTDVSFRVVKNTLAKLAAEKAGFDDVEELFAGPTAVAFVRGDAALVAKVLGNTKVGDEKLEVRGGVMDGRRVDASQVKEIASLPSREVILAMLLSAVNAPMAMTVGVLAAPCRDLVMILDAYIEKRQKEEAA